MVTQLVNSTHLAFCGLSVINSMRAHKMAIVVLSDSPMCLGPKGSLVLNPSIAWSPSNVETIVTIQSVQRCVQYALHYIQGKYSQIYHTNNLIITDTKNLYTYKYL